MAAVNTKERRLLRGAIPDLKVVPTYIALEPRRSLAAPVNVLVIVIIIVIRIRLKVSKFDIHAQNIQDNVVARCSGDSVNA